ncbi:hypothetical protein GCM10027346_01300 [Hymenobacter seoulensis]
MPDPPKSVGLFRKFVSTARSITTGQVALPLGISRLNKNVYWLKWHKIKPLTDEELKIVEAYYAQIMNYPLDEKQQHIWAPAALQRKQAELKELTDLYRPHLMPILTRIVTEAALSTTST